MFIYINLVLEIKNKKRNFLKFEYLCVKENK